MVGCQPDSVLAAVVAEEEHKVLRELVKTAVESAVEKPEKER